MCDLVCPSFLWRAKQFFSIKLRRDNKNLHKIVLFLHFFGVEMTATLRLIVMTSHCLRVLKIQSPPSVQYVPSIVRGCCGGFHPEVWGSPR